MTPFDSEADQIFLPWRGPPPRKKNKTKGVMSPSRSDRAVKNPEGIPGRFLYLGGGTKSRVWGRQLRLLSERQGLRLFSYQPITGLRSWTLSHVLFSPVMEMFLKRPPRPLWRRLWSLKASKMGLDLVIVRGGREKKKNHWIHSNSCSAACWDCAHNVLWLQRRDIHLGYTCAN